MDIYSILASKPHNPHYLNRYWKFIQTCQVANQNLSDDVYIERHHICPKAKSLFPEYESFRINPWNEAVLTGRQHLIAHLILAKVYIDGSMRSSFILMTRVIKLDGESNNLNRKYHIFRKRVTEAISNQMKEEKAHIRLHEALRGSVVYNNGLEEIKIKGEPPRGFVLGRLPRTEEHSKNQIKGSTSACKGSIIYNDGLKNYHVKSREHVPSHWVKGMKPQKERTEFLIFNGSEYKKLRKGERTPEGFKRTNSSQISRSELQDIPFFHEVYTPFVPPPKIPKIIIEKPKKEKIPKIVKEPKPNKSEFIGPRIDKRKIKGKKASENSMRRLRETNTGSVYYNNGTEVKKFKEHPGEGWVLGTIVADDLKDKRRLATIDRCLGTTTYNDGIRNYTVKPGDEIPSHWVKGMKPQKERTEFLISNGTQYRKLRKNEKIPEGYFRAKASELHNKELEKIPFFHEVYTPKPGIK